MTPAQGGEQLGILEEQGRQNSQITHIFLPALQPQCCKKEAVHGSALVTQIKAVRQRRRDPRALFSHLVKP